MSEKKSAIKHPVLDIIEKRWSPRSFQDKAIPKEDLMSMFEAARWAPSSFNGQPWRFIIANREDKENYKRLYDCLIEFNQGWVEPAPILGISIGRKRFEQTDKANKHHLHDVGLAMSLLVLEGMQRGVYVHQMSGFDVDKTHELLEIPEGYEPCAMFVLGYPGSPDQLSDELKEKELATGERKPMEEMLFEGKFGKSF